MNCPLCNTEMIIDEWGGWRWTCFHCDYIGREATDEEVEEYKHEMAKFGYHTG